MGHIADALKEAFKDESKELSVLCKDNNIEEMHTGGMFAYCRSVGFDDVYWFIVNEDFELPTHVDDVVVCSLDIDSFKQVKYEDLVEFFDNIKLPNFTFSHDQFCEIKGLAFKDVIDSMQQVNNLLIKYINRLEQTT